MKSTAELTLAVEQMKTELVFWNRMIFNDILIYGIAFYHKPSKMLIDPSTMVERDGKWYQTLNGKSRAIANDELFIIQHR
jgi:hypothetical protein